MKNKKKHFIILALSCLMIGTLFTGMASAANGDFATPRYSSPPFEFELPAHGNTVVGKSEEKTEKGDAYFSILDIYNDSGMPCYLNVRTSNGATRAGNATAVSGRGYHYVSYKSGYGQIGNYYCPAGQTDNDSGKTAQISGAWHP